MSGVIRTHIALMLFAAAAAVRADAAASDQHHQHAPALDQTQHEHTTRPSHAESGHAHHEAAGDVPTESERRHVPPDPPQHVMGDMSPEEMVGMMGMDDTKPYGLVLFDQLEWRDTDNESALAWDGRAFYGNDYNKLLLKTEGEHLDGEYEASAELLWDHVFSRWWSFQAGIAHDFGEGPSRTWAAFGLQGLAPYWFEVEALLYVGEEGRTAAKFSAEYEMFLTQRMILQPKLELAAYGEDDQANGIGSGLSEAELGLRLRYEIRREFAPYIGVSWSRSFGNTADLVRSRGGDREEVQFVAGLRAWF